MKVEILKKTYAFGHERHLGTTHILTEQQGEKLIKRGLAKEVKKAYSTKEMKLNKETKDVSKKD